ncbi:unnamed protein product [Hymenolepis diminuta]|uniref:Asp_protease domain-containing protein n=1 Tax=Hymenolepis diminuta TaxID=6216 RepID=A0A158QG85_HYMDI|nr:unnamed protein product [Hymenolepis diminuta]
MIALTPIPPTALMMGKRISIDEKVLYELFVEGWLSKDPVLITINTGSVYSLISRACVERCGLRKYVTCGRINACLLTLGGATIEVSLLVAEDLSRDITLGLDTLKQHRFFIDFDRDEILIGRYGRVKFAIGKPIQLHKRSRKQRTQSPTRQLTKVQNEHYHRSPSGTKYLDDIPFQKVDDEIDYSLKSASRSFEGKLLKEETSSGLREIDTSSMRSTKFLKRRSTNEGRDGGDRKTDVNTTPPSGYLEDKISLKAMSNTFSEADEEAIRRPIQEEFLDTYAIPLIKLDRKISNKQQR